MAAMGNERHMEAGEKEPRPPGKDVLRVYGMKFCPFVQRLKLVLSAKGIEHETVNINLQKKPDWFLAKAPRGTVPVIEKNGEFVFESDITSEFVDLAYDGKTKLIESDPLRRAKGKMLLGDLGTGAFFSNLRANDDNKVQEREKMMKCLKALDCYLQESGCSFISGDNPGMNDFMFWPFLERISIWYMDRVKEMDGVYSYYLRMGENEAVKSCRHEESLLRQLIQSYVDGSATYDIGTVLPAIE